MESFLHKKAISFEEKHNSRTYLILDEIGQVLAYFSITFKELELHSEMKLSKSTIQRMDGFSKNAEKIRSFLIGQIGKNNSVAKNPINLEIILGYVYDVIAEVRSMIGGRLIILECNSKNKRLIEHYQSHGFTALFTNQEYITMYSFIQAFE